MNLFKLCPHFGGFEVVSRQNETKSLQGFLGLL